MKVITITRSFLLTAALFLVLGTSLTAQRNYSFKIDSPLFPNPFLAVTASFGPDFCTNPTVSGNLIFVDDGVAPGTDGCTAPMNTITGKVAVIDRGSCNFDIKCLNAQQAGAIAVIVINNQPTAPFIMPGATVGAQVTIPCFMISQADGALFRDDLLFGISFPCMLTPNITQFPANINVLWGDGPGEGDFDGNLGNWTVNDISCGNGATGFGMWRWAQKGNITGGAFGSGSVNSPSYCNGAASFYSDQYDNGGDPNNQGGGPCTAPQEGELISPAIDLSGTPTAGVSLLFFQTIRHFTNSQYFIAWSTDDGTTWTEKQINQDLVVNAAAINGPVRIAMPGAAGASNLLVKFRYVANYYYWMIDDVRIIEQEANNMQVNGNFFAIPQNAVFPLGQIDPIVFLADIENVGAVEQTNVNLNVSIKNDGTGAQVFTADNFYGSVPSNTIVENVLFPDQFIPDLPKGNYSGVYVIDQTQVDFDTTNNKQSFSFTISDTTFSKEPVSTRDILPAAGNWTAGEPHNWTYGNAYYIEGQEDFIATSISFGLGNANTIPGRTIVLNLYFWVDTDNDGNCQSTERTLLGQEAYSVLGTEADADIITVPFGDLTPDPVLLELSGQYIVMLEYAEGADLVDCAFRANGDFDYSAMVFASNANATPRFAAMLAIDETLGDETFSSLGFGRDLVPVARLNVAKLTGVKDPLPADNIVEIFPNPASSVINLKLDFVKLQSNLHIQVLDLHGRVAFEQSYDNIQKNTLTLDASRFASGAYTLRVLTNDGVRTAKFVVSK